MYKVLFPKVQMRMDSETVSFSINHMKSRKPSICAVILHLLRGNQTQITTKQVRWVVTKDYHTFTKAFTLTEAQRNDTAYVQVELDFYNVSSENPCYFTECMLQEGEFTEYHTPEEVNDNVLVGFDDNNYANLYSSNDVYLQVIRPAKDSLSTKLIPKSDCTILAPHIPAENAYDNPVNLFYEVMNQKEQETNIEK